MSELDVAIGYLRQHGACRDAAAGQWMLADGIPLGANPVEAARNLRRMLIQKSVDEARNSGRGFTRCH